jgi:GNAT superfamily N-acetyltransferase
MLDAVTGDVFEGGLALSAAAALWGWLLSLLLGAALLPERRPDGDAGGRLLAWLVLGTAVQAQLWLVTGWLVGLTPRRVALVAALLTALCTAAAGGRIVACLRMQRKPVDGLFLGSSAALAIFLALTAWLAAWPTVFYDDLVYHLGLPRQALLTGGWPSLEGLHYSFMPAGWDAVYVLPLAVGAGRGPQLMNLVALGLFAWAVYRLARRGAGPGAAAAATALLILAPMFVSLGAFAGNDLFVGLALCVAVERMLATEGKRPLLVGLLLGAAWGAKYSALAGCAGACLALGLVRRGTPTARAMAATAAGLACLLVPLAWTLRSYVLTGNPLYPAFFGVLGGEHWTSASAALVGEQVSHGGLANRGLTALGLALVDLVLRSDTLGFPSGINPAFAFLGLAGILAHRRVRGAAPLLVVAGVSYLGWCVTSLNLRYGLILLAALAPFAGAAVDQGVALLERPLPQRTARRVAVALVWLLAATSVLTGIQRHVRAYGAGTTFLTAERRADMLARRVHLAAAGRRMAELLPREARVLLVADGRIGLLPRAAVASSAYDRPDMARLLAAAKSDAELQALLAGFTHVVVNYRELERFRRSYRFEEHFRPGDWPRFERWLREDLEPLEQVGQVVIYRLRHTKEGP